jgi:hypothetical protein
MRLKLIVPVAMLLLTVFSLQFIPEREVTAQAPTVTNLNTTSIATTTTFAGGDWAGGKEPYTTADIFTFIDQADVNTLTLTLQVSPDNTTFVDHSASSALVTNNAADANAYTAAAIHGRFFQIVATAGNTNTVTPTIIVVLR